MCRAARVSVSWASGVSQERDLTILTPAKDGWTQLASFHFLGPVLPWPQVDTIPFFFASSPA